MLSGDRRVKRLGLLMTWLEGLIKVAGSRAKSYGKVL
jgi:hypothetical protein